MTDAILFDLDGTLCEYERSGDELLALAFERAGVDPLFAAEDYYDVFEEHAEQGDSVAGIREKCFAALAADAGADPEVGRAVARAYADERDHRNVRFRAGAAELLDEVTEAYPVGLVTNGGPGMQGEKVDALGIADAFDAVVYAGYEAPAKPDPAPFHRALDVLGAAPEAAIHVGNSLPADVAGANAAGVTSAWISDGVTDPGEHDPDYVLDSLCDLRDVLTPPG